MSEKTTAAEWAALKYAQRLATYAAKKFGPPEGWKPLDDMYGVLSQIDNMLTGLERHDADALSQRDARIAELEEGLGRVAVFALKHFRDKEPHELQAALFTCRAIAVTTRMTPEERARALLSPAVEGGGGEWNSSSVAESAARITSDHADQPAPDFSGSWRCTRCGRDEIDAKATGCARGPCPMELQR